MTRLRRDRVLEYAPDCACDLVTGAPATLDAGDAPACGEPPLEAVIDLLDHGREGRPRCLALDAHGGGAPPGWTRAAADARARGYVAVGVEVFLRWRPLLAEDLRDRALLLLAPAGTPPAMARRALVGAAALSPRPHVLLTVTLPARPAPAAAGPFRLHEARAAYAAETTPAPEDIRRLLARAARAQEFAAAGRHAAAERLLRDVAAALLRRRAPQPASTVLVALGRLLLDRGRAVDADTVFGEAADHLAASGHEAASDAARVWQAAARTDAARLSAAEALCRAALLAGQLDGGESARAEATLARVLLWQQRVDDIDWVPAAGEDGAGGARGGAFAQATAVRLLLARGAIFEAGVRAGDLLASTRAAGDPTERLFAQLAHLRVLAAAGDLAAAAARRLDAWRAAREARAPLRLARADLIWAGALVRAGRTREAQQVRARLARLRAVAPALLRGALDQVARDSPPPAPPGVGVGHGQAAARFVALAQQGEDDRAALANVLEQLRRQSGAGRVDLCSCDAGPVAVLLSAGHGLPTRLGARVLDAGIVVGPEADGGGGEIGAPVRLGPKLVAALVARWPADRTPPRDAADLLLLAAAVAAPRIDAWRLAARDESASAAAIPELVGVSAAMTALRQGVARAAAAPFAVLILGESGVGKELVARAIHQLSPRRERRFCDVNCAALPDELLESELFGHARGAFTGAVADRRGLVEEADGGTLFLDEVVDLSARAQAKLLRVMQQQEVRRVGETFSRAVDVRIVSAANRDVRDEVAAGRFRADLQYRLDVIRLQVPPLRERPDDIPPLVRHFWRTAAARVGTQAVLTHGVITALARYHWPGNVRELQNVMAALAVDAPARGAVRAARLPAAITGATAVTAGRLADARTQFERRFVEAALARANGRRTTAARDLGLSRQGLLKLMARLGLGSAPAGTPGSGGDEAKHTDSM